MEHLKIRFNTQYYNFFLKAVSLQKGYSDNLEFSCDGSSNDTVELDLVNKVSFKKFKMVFIGFRVTFKTKTESVKFCLIDHGVWRGQLHPIQILPSWLTSQLPI